MSTAIPEAIRILVMTLGEESVEDDDVVNNVTIIHCRYGILLDEEK